MPQHSTITCSRKRGALGSWLLVTFLCLNLSSPLEASINTKGPNANGCPADINGLLPNATHMMKMSEIALHQFQKEFNCTLERNPTEDPKNEEMIRKTCMGETCNSRETYVELVNHDSQTATSCIGTIYKTLMSYVIDIKYLDSAGLLNSMNNIMQALKANHIEVQPLPSPLHPLTKRFEVQMKQCSILLILKQLSQTIHRNLSYLQKSLKMTTHC